MKFILNYSCGSFKQYMFYYLNYNYLNENENEKREQL